MWFSRLVSVVVYLDPAREIAIDLTAQIRGFGAMAPIITFSVFVITAIAGFSRAV